MEVDDFIFRVEWQAQLYGITDSTLAFGLGELLTDRANQWFWTYQRATECANWNQLKQALIQRFSPGRDSDYEIRAKIVSRCQRHNESFSDFCLDIEALAVKLTKRMRNDELVEILRHNMRFELQEALCFKQTSTVEELIRCCYQFEKLELHHKNRSPARIAELENHISLHDSSYYADNHKPNKIATTSNNQKLGNGVQICWNCKELGHVFKKCNRQQLSIFCFSCGSSVRPQCQKCLGNVWKGSPNVFNLPPPLNYTATNMYSTPKKLFQQTQ